MSASRADRPAASVRRGIVAALSMLAAGGAASAPAQTGGGPIRLTPAPIVATPEPAPGTAAAPSQTSPAAPVSLHPSPSSTPAPAPLPDDVVTTVRAPVSIRGEALGPPDPDGAGVLEGAQGLGGDPWRGIDRATVIEMVAALPVATPSPAAKTLQRRLLLSTGSPAAAAAGEAAPPPRRFGAVRVEKLAAMGDPRGAAELAARLPEALADEAAAQALTDAELLAGPVDCPRAVERGTRFASPYWVKLEVYCRARSGDRAGAGEALGRLKAQSFPDDGFLPVAETLAGGPPPAVRTLKSADALTLAGLRLAQIAAPVDSLSLADPWKLAAVAANGTTDPVTRALAGERAAAALFLDVRTLTEIYRAVPARGDELLRVRDLAGRDPSARTRALLHQAMAATMEGGRRIELARLAAELVEPGLRAGPVGNAATSLLDTVAPTADAGGMAASAARLYYALGRPEAARRWHDLALRGGRSAEVAWLWPLAVVAGGIQPGEAGLAAWIEEEARGADDAVRGRIAGQLALLQAAGIPVPAEAWVRLTGAVPAAGAQDRPPTADPALWQRLGEASAAGRVGETVLVSLLLLGEAGPAATAPAITARMVDGLRAVGLETDARALAREAMSALAGPAGG